MPRPITGGRKYLDVRFGRNDSYFPDRVPRPSNSTFNERDPNDHYARLYSDQVVTAVNGSHPTALRSRQLHRCDATRSPNRQPNRKN